MAGEFRWPAEDLLWNHPRTHRYRQAESGKERMKFEEFFLLQIHVLRHRIRIRNNFRGLTMEKIGETFHQFYSEVLPFAPRKASE